MAGALAMAYQSGVAELGSVAVNPNSSLELVVRCAACDVDRSYRRTASKFYDADEAAPLAKRDCTASAANDRQQTYLEAFRVRPLQTSETSTATTPGQGAMEPRFEGGCPS